MNEKLRKSIKDILGQFVQLGHGDKAIDDIEDAFIQEMCGNCEFTPTEDTAGAHSAHYPR